MSRLMILVLLFAHFSAEGRKREVWMNDEQAWKRLKLVENISPVEIASINADTTIVVASNRLMLKDSLRFMSEDLEKNGNHYFFLYVKNGIWHLVPTASLYEALQYVPDKNKDWLVYTEGMGKVFTGSLYRGVRVSAYYNVNVLMLDYPSIHPDKRSLGNYSFAINNAREAYKSFAPVIDTIKILREQLNMGHGSLSFFFHSMGNNLMKELVVKKKINNYNDNTWVDNIILNAPCVQQKKHKSWVEQIKFARNIYVHYNPEDRTLGLAQLASFKKQLGKNLKAPLASNAIYINFNSVAGNAHSNFLPFQSKSLPDVPEMHEHYKLLFHGESVLPARSSAYYPSNDEKGWNIVSHQHNTAAR
jgi:hypothetical protein